MLFKYFFFVSFHTERPNFAAVDRGGFKGSSCFHFTSCLVYFMLLIAIKLGETIIVLQLRESISTKKNEEKK